MTHIYRKRGPALSATLSLYILLSALGIVYCLLALTGLQRCALPQCTLVLYAAYFAMCVVCTVAIFRWKRWGVWGLGTATFSVGVIGLIQHALTLHDLLVWIGFIAASVIVLQSAWPYLE
jgi:hypothetical protein